MELDAVANDEVPSFVVGAALKRLKNVRHNFAIRSLFNPGLVNRASAHEC